ncbi:hypothetical protein HC928_06660 [bacterium]|nr:hypothetical protein [bacterium]
MRKFLLIAIGCLFSFGLTIPASHVQACSGSARPWHELLPEMVGQSDTIVVGQYVELDDADANGIFRVGEYLEGTGAEHLLIRNAPSTYIENRRHVNRRLSLCGGPPTLNTDDIHIYFLNRQADGTYTIRMRHSFADQTSTIGLVNQPGEPEDLTVADISDQISAEVGFDPVLPDEDSAYPRTAPILLKVANGQHFLLPVDTHELVPVPDDEVISLRRDQYECGPPPSTCILRMDLTSYFWTTATRTQTTVAKTYSRCFITRAASASSFPPPVRRMQFGAMMKFRCFCYGIHVWDIQMIDFRTSRHCQSWLTA